MNTTPLPVMSDQSGRFIQWKGGLYKLMKSRADAYSDAHRLRRKNNMRAYRAKKREAVEKVTRAEDVQTVVATV